MIFHRRKLLRFAGLAALSTMPRFATAQAYPARPIRLIVPFPPGGVTDAVGRRWAERVKPELGVVVIENIGGAAGSIGAATVARAQPDGYTLLLGSANTHVVKGLDNRLPQSELCTAGQRIAYKIPGSKIFLEVKVQRAAIVLHLADGGIPDPNGLAEDIPESHGWRQLKKRIAILNMADLDAAMPFIEAALRAEHH